MLKITNMTLYDNNDPIAITAIAATRQRNILI
jgi:hypothetical protein